MNNNFLNGLLAASIMIAALLISGAWIYTAGKNVASAEQDNHGHDQAGISLPVKSGGCGI